MMQHNMTGHTPEARLHLVGPDETFEDSSLLNRVQTLGVRDGGLIEARVPVELICREDVPVDQAHVDELKDSIARESGNNNGSGQLTPILLAEVPGTEQFSIIDGFHRDAALSQLGRRDVYATVRPNTTPEEVLDLRLLTANTHKSVSFARIVEWIDDAWGKTPWTDRLTPSQAFGMSYVNSSGKKLGLSEDEAVAVKTWVQDKCVKWRMTAGSIRLNLVTAETVAPELLHAARQRPGGRELTELTPLHLRAIADELPKRFDEQRLVADIAKMHNMSAPRTRAVAAIIGAARTVEEAQEIYSQTDWSKVAPKHGRTRTRELEKMNEGEEQKVRGQSDEALSLKARRGFLLTHLELAVASLQNLVYRGDYVVPNEAEQHMTPTVRVEYDNDLHIQRILQPGNTMRAEEVFVERMQQIQKKLVEKIMSDTGMSLGNANALTYVVADRISADINEGGMQFVGEVHPAVLDRVVRNAVYDELRRDRDIHTITGAKRGRPKSEATTVDVESVLEVFTGLKAIDCKHMALEGFMQLSNRVVAQVLDIDLGSAASMSRALKRRFAGVTPPATQELPAAASDS